MRRRTKIFAGGCGCLVLGFIGLAILGAVAGGQRSTPQVVATPTVGTMAAPAPPTATPVAPASQAPTPPSKPSAPPAPPEPTAAPATASAVRVLVRGTGADGVNMRAEPSITAARVKLLRDGAQLEIVGEDRQADGRTWHNVRDMADGATGWVAAEFIAEHPAAPQPPAAIESTPRPTPTTAPVAEKPAASAAPAPKTAGAPAYEWVAIDQVATPNRPRYRVHLVVNQSYDDDQMTAVFRDAVARAFRERSNAKAIVVFAFSSRAEVGRGADKGKAEASTDKLGWTGDGKFDAITDEGKIYMTLGSLLGLSSTRQIAVDQAAPATAAPKPSAPAPKPASGTTCGSYPSQAAAQAAYRANPIGLRGMDSDGDGIACESNPGPFDRVPVAR